MAFLFDAWYAAAWSGEVGRELLHRKFLGEDVVLFRRRDGAPAALAARCPHRFAPLHYGQLLHGDVVRCRYHGLEFGADGACVRNPNDEGPPPPLRVKTYPVVERNRTIWIWMGSPEAADHNQVSAEFDYLSQPERYTVSQDAMTIGCDYQLVLDNLLDAAHANFLHDASLGSEALTHAKTEVRTEGEAILADRWAPNGAPSPFLGHFLGDMTASVDQWANARWEPATLMSIDAGATRLGAPIDEGIRFRVAHLVTPESATRCHYFWATARNFRLDDEALTEQLSATTNQIFTSEDKWMLEGQQRMLGETQFWDARPKLLAGDRAAVAVRRRLDQLIKAEREAAVAR